MILKSLKYPCYPCEYKAKAKSNLKSHIESVHISKYSCNDCDKQYKSRTEVKQHIESVNSKIPVINVQIIYIKCKNTY